MLISDQSSMQPTREVDIVALVGVAHWQAERMWHGRCSPSIAAVCSATDAGEMPARTQLLLRAWRTGQMASRSVRELTPPKRRSTALLRRVWPVA